MCVCVCVLVLQTMPCSQHKTHCVNQHCISLYVLYSARNMFKIIIACYFDLVIIHCWSSGFLTTSCSTRSPKWLVGTHCTSTGPPTAYWGWTSTWVGGTGDGVEVNMGGVEVNMGGVEWGG